MSEVEEKEVQKDEDPTLLLDEAGTAAKIYVKRFDDDLIETMLQLSLIEGKRDIYIISAGGNVAAANVMVNLINQEPEKYTIYVTEQVYSSAFFTILYANCDIVDIGLATNMFTVFMTHNGRIESRIPKYVRKCLDDTNEKMFDDIKHVLTDKQIKQHKRHMWVYKNLKIFPFLQRWFDDDLYLTREQVKELLGDRLLLPGEDEDGKEVV